MTTHQTSTILVTPDMPETQRFLDLLHHGEEVFTEIQQKIRERE
jgi:hypothetical protein